MAPKRKKSTHGHTLMENGKCCQKAARISGHCWRHGACPKCKATNADGTQCDRVVSAKGLCSKHITTDAVEVRFPLEDAQIAVVIPHRDTCSDCKVNKAEYAGTDCICTSRQLCVKCVAKEKRRSKRISGTSCIRCPFCLHDTEFAKPRVRSYNASGKYRSEKVQRLRRQDSLADIEAWELLQAGILYIGQLKESPAEKESKLHFLKNKLEPHSDRIGDQNIVEDLKNEWTKLTGTGEMEVWQVLRLALSKSMPCQQFGNCWATRPALGNKRRNEPVHQMLLDLFVPFEFGTLAYTMRKRYADCEENSIKEEVDTFLFERIPAEKHLNMQKVEEVSQIWNDVIAREVAPEWMVRRVIYIRGRRSGGSFPHWVSDPSVAAASICAKAQKTSDRQSFEDAIVDYDSAISSICRRELQLRQLGREIPTEPIPTVPVPDESTTHHLAIDSCVTSELAAFLAQEESDYEGAFDDAEVILTPSLKSIIPTRKKNEKELKEEAAEHHYRWVVGELEESKLKKGQLEAALCTQLENRPVFWCNSTLQALRKVATHKLKHVYPALLLPCIKPVQQAKQPTSADPEDETMLDSLEKDLEEDEENQKERFALQKQVRELKGELNDLLVALAPRMTQEALPTSTLHPPVVVDIDAEAIRLTRIVRCLSDEQMDIVVPKLISQGIHVADEDHDIVLDLHTFNPHELAIVSRELDQALIEAQRPPKLLTDEPKRARYDDNAQSEEEDMRALEEFLRD